MLASRHVHRFSLALGTLACALAAVACGSGSGGSGGSGATGGGGTGGAPPGCEPTASWTPSAACGVFVSPGGDDLVGDGSPDAFTTLTARSSMRKRSGTWGAGGGAP